jgi:4-hydroxybenzoyl-CoA reductase subunit beta
MRLPDFDHYRPHDLEEVFSILAGSGDARVIAGGTDLIPRMKFGLETPSTIVSLGKVERLKGITRSEGRVTVGAMTTLAEMIASPVISRDLPALREAAMAVAAPPVWNVATLGGNILQNTRCLYYNQSRTWRLEKEPCLKASGDVCHAAAKGKKCFSVYCGDIAPALIAFDAVLLFEGLSGPRELSCSDIFSGNGLSPFNLEKDVVLTGIRVPVRDTRSAYAKLRVRSALDYPLVSAAACLVIGPCSTITGGKLGLSAVGPAPQAIGLDFLAGRTIDTLDLEVLHDILPKKLAIVDNLALPGSYRRKMVPVIARKAIAKAAAQGKAQEAI